jgi:hypothetical protein
MADYYPLISRAVAGLDKNTGEARRAVYERARGALLAQLRGVTPALNESDITRERLALEEAIRKVEAESARQFVDTSRTPQPPPRLRPAEPEAPRAQPRDDAFRAAARPAAASPRPRAPELDQWDEAPRLPLRRSGARRRRRRRQGGRAGTQLRRCAGRDRRCRPRPHATAPKQVHVRPAAAVEPAPPRAIRCAGRIGARCRFRPQGFP